MKYFLLKGDQLIMLYQNLIISVTNILRQERNLVQLKSFANKVNDKIQ